MSKVSDDELREALRHRAGLRETTPTDAYVMLQAEQRIRQIEAVSSIHEADPGWKLVPLEPTIAMIDAGDDPQFGNGPDIVRHIYQTMLTAAPASIHEAEPVAWVMEPSGLAVATIVHDDFSLVEIVKSPRTGAARLLTIHRTNEETGRRDDMSIDLTEDQEKTVAAALLAHPNPISKGVTVKALDDPANMIEALKGLYFSMALWPKVNEVVNFEVGTGTKDGKAILAARELLKQAGEL